MATSAPIVTRDHDRRAGLLVHVREAPRQQPVAAHREQHPHGADHQRHHHRRQAGDRSGRDQRGEPVLADVLEGRGERGVGVDLLVR